MWSASLVSAIKSDLLDFVTTIQSDTQSTLAKVIGEEIDEEAEEISFRERKLLDIKRSFNTYSIPVEEENQKEYDKFLKTFSLSTYAVEIAGTILILLQLLSGHGLLFSTGILDEEVDVSRYYAELVPVKITPDEFWSRYFFKLMLLMRHGIAPLDDDDDEDIAWETDDPTSAEKSAGLGAFPLLFFFRYCCIFS
jgi:BSD domain